MNLEEYKIELLSDFDELINFYTGKDKMDDFLHNCLILQKKSCTRQFESKLSLRSFA